MEFRDKATRAVGAEHGGNSLFDEEGSIRLATTLVTRNKNFLKDMSTFRHKHNFVTKDDARDNNEEERTSFNNDTWAWTPK